MDCLICLETNCVSGVKCLTCKNSCCITCEHKYNSCPFCRTKLPQWFMRLIKNPYITQLYFNEYTKVNTEEQLKYIKLEQLVYEMLSRGIEVHKLNNYSNEELLSILYILRENVYEISEDSDSLNYISYILDWIEYIWSKVNIVTDFNIDLDYIQDNIIKEHKEKLKKYQKFLYKNTPKMNFKINNKKTIKYYKVFNK